MVCAPVYQTESGTFSPHCHLLPFTKGHLLLSNLPQGRHGGLWGRSLGPSCFPCVCVSCLPGLQLPPAGQKRACDANWQLQTVSRSECECEWSFVFLWPAINWQLVHAVALPWHPRTAGIGCTQPPATLSAGEAVCLYSTSAFSFIYLFYVACTNKENFSR